MKNWASGYITDLTYTHGFYRELTPHILTFSLLTRNRDAKNASGLRPAGLRPAYCELGCGQGFSTNLLAAANPDIDFYGVDFNPAHIVGSNRLAEEAGMKNVHFFDDSFAQFNARTDLPQFDIIALHGVYGWIAKEHRETIVRFIDQRLKPGGIVYISYNCLPGWAGPGPLRQLICFASDATTGTSAQRVDAGFALIERMQAARAQYFSSVPSLAKRVEKLKEQDRAYLAHEFMNDSWTAFYHADVAQDMAAARLSYVGSARLLEHIDIINMTAEQQAILDETIDPAVRETLRDYMTNEQFRRDIFVRGPIPLTPNEAREIWLDSHFVLTTPREEVGDKVTGALGEATLHADVYSPLLDAFTHADTGEGGKAMSLRQIFANAPAVAELEWARVHEAITLLVGANHLQPCPATEEENGQRHESAKRFNRAVMARARHSSDLQCLASPVTGGGIGVGRIQQLFLLALAENDEDPARFVWRILEAQDQRLVKDGRVLDGEEENVAELNESHTAFQKRIPLLRNLGII
ncbi:MAG: class I SAM-dependent methyltransferase [Candidatus Accumulibacter sp.]|jgi:SAM-dependent methyltransferase|nr:class I SAM-dependent methyltransferase [Accumulibacter sp.]